MSLSPEAVLKIAHLARLNLSPAEIPGFTDKLSRILAFIEQMNQIDTQAIEPLAHPLDLGQRLRTDAVTEPDLRDKYQKIAPLVTAGLYLVPQVIEEGE